MSEKLSLIADANVIIDYLKVDRSVIRLINSYVGQLYLVTPLLNEIDEMDESNCLELEIKLVESELHQMMLASQNLIVFFCAFIMGLAGIEQTTRRK